MSAEPGGESPEKFAVFIKAEIGKWAKIAKEAGLKVE
jgi:tripartite-type tricarboxylate transporter receptor subunit TctC